ncbi:hypothetical protein EYF80_045146 [Liparis tanakae]|uniref:Uncharacterized protein n=1 Tax=Liparis tanakae TaxID=230148 RepID=A0A4Z2FUV6_9TELE|nr:hypothetical protein EYF80_045146 [Liparis tanakae]
MTRPRQARLCSLGQDCLGLRLLVRIRGVLPAQINFGRTGKQTTGASSHYISTVARYQSFC